MACLFKVKFDNPHLSSKKECCEHLNEWGLRVSQVESCSLCAGALTCPLQFSEGDMVRWNMGAQRSLRAQVVIISSPVVKIIIKGKIPCTIKEQWVNLSQLERINGNH